MSELNRIRLNKVLKELNISMQTAADFFSSRDLKIETRPNTKVSMEVYQLLLDEFQSDKSLAKKSEEVSKAKQREKEEMLAQREVAAKKEAEQAAKQAVIRAKAQILEVPKTLGKIELDKAGPKRRPKRTPRSGPESQAAVPEAQLQTDAKKPKADPLRTASPTAETAAEQQPTTTTKAEPQTAQHPSNTPGVVKTVYQKLDGLNFTGEKIDLSKFAKKPVPRSTSESVKQDKPKGKRKRKRIRKEIAIEKSRKQSGGRRGIGRGKSFKAEPTEEEIQKQIKETLDKLTNKKGGKSKAYKFRKEKRDARREQREQEILQQEEAGKVLQVTEFVTVGELSTLMKVPSTQVIATCMSLGIMVTMNQRLDAETLSIVADEFGFEVNFTTADLELEEAVEADDPAALKPRAPVVTVMGHVDHGKTSLLDYIRKSNVIAGEAGGITQHIAAYKVRLDDARSITFLDTPGHEAFTAMRARGAQITDIAIIVIAADDDVMPQTREAISHAQAASVPMVIAINKVDKAGANPDKVKETLAGMNVLVEDWGGEIQSQDLSAKTGQGVEELLEKVLLEAEMLDLKANPDRDAVGTVIEASLDKGRGYVSTLLVQTGTIRLGDCVLAGYHSGKVKAMLDERSRNIQEALPATPVVILGLDGAPTAGDKFKVYQDEREAKNKASKLEQLQREQDVRTQKHITLDEIGRRIALGDFKELNIIIKGDVDGSVEALSDSLQKLATEEIQINTVHKGVGQITESDVLLASASDAIIIGFQVRPDANARGIAEREQIDIRTYSVIYDAIDDLRDAMEGMLSPETKEQVLGNVEIRETFKISRVGTIAGCMVIDGKLTRNSNIRLIRDGVVIHTGALASLKRFKEDVKEVTKGYECGLNVKNYNDIKVGDLIEAYEEVEVLKSLK